MMDCTERDSNRSISAEAAQRVHLILEGHVLRTVATRLQDLAYLAMRGARQAKSRVIGEVSLRGLTASSSSPCRMR